MNKSYLRPFLSIPTFMVSAQSCNRDPGAQLVIMRLEHPAVTVTFFFFFSGRINGEIIMGDHVTFLLNDPW